MKKSIVHLILPIIGVAALACLVGMKAGETVEPEVVETSPVTIEKEDIPLLEIPDLTPPEPGTDVIDALAKTVYGEARGCSTMEQAAVVWCILNRVDAGTENIMEVITAPNQFQGYDPANPIDTEIVALVKDVLTRWQIEKDCVGSVGRVLPSDYLWFTGDGTHNYFRNNYSGNTTWDWSLPNPYDEEGVTP
jgi:hypothetical protein